MTFFCSSDFLWSGLGCFSNTVSWVGINANCEQEGILLWEKVIICVDKYVRRVVASQRFLHIEEPFLSSRHDDLYVGRKRGVKDNLVQSLSRKEVQTCPGGSRKMCGDNKVMPYALMST